MLREDLDLLREASGCDAAFAITLDATGLVFDQVAVSRSTFAQCHPEALRGESFETHVNPAAAKRQGVTLPEALLKLSEIYGKLGDPIRAKEVLEKLIQVKMGFFG